MIRCVVSDIPFKQPDMLFQPLTEAEVLHAQESRHVQEVIYQCLRNVTWQAVRNKKVLQWRQGQICCCRLVCDIDLTLFLLQPSICKLHVPER